MKGFDKWKAMGILQGADRNRYSWMRWWVIRLEEAHWCGEAVFVRKCGTNDWPEWDMLMDWGKANEEWECCSQLQRCRFPIIEPNILELERNAMKALGFNTNA